MRYYLALKADAGSVPCSTAMKICFKSSIPELKPLI